jgi:hypothetical protein
MPNPNSLDIGIIQVAVSTCALSSLKYTGGYYAPNKILFWFDAGKIASQ